jgi:tetratricopeptide (TPR) repeat protein
MTGQRFLKLVRRNMGMQRIPLIMVTLENHQHAVLDAIRHGVTGYVLRPYSLATFERHVSFAHQMENYQELEELQLEDAKEMVEMGEIDGAIQAFEEIVQVKDEAQKFYDLGCKYLAMRNYGRAIVAFKKAVRINTLFAEAYKGLADAYRLKGEEERANEFLQKAANIHAQFNRLEKAKEAFIEILKYQADAPNPFNTLGVRLRKQHDYVGALHAYEQALELTPDDENIYYNIAKCCYFMGQTRRAVAAIREALSRNPGFKEAMNFFETLTGKPWTAPASADGLAASTSGSLIDTDTDTAEFIVEDDDGSDGAS